MEDDWIERAFPGIDAEFVAGMTDGRNLSTPEPSANRHPAYRHAWEVHRAEVEGWIIPADWSRQRAKHIEDGGDFYPYPCAQNTPPKGEG